MAGAGGNPVKTQEESAYGALTYADNNFQFISDLNCIFLLSGLLRRGIPEIVFTGLPPAPAAYAWDYLYNLQQIRLMVLAII